MIPSVLASIAFERIPLLWSGLQLVAAIAVATSGVALFRRAAAALGRPLRWWEYLFDLPTGQTPFHSLMGIQVHWWAILPLLLAVFLYQIEVGATEVPVAFAGEDLVVEVGETVTLDGTLSTLASGVPSWRVLEAPVGSQPTLDRADTLYAALQVDAPGRYVVELTISGDPPVRDSLVIEAATGPDR